MIFLNDRFIMSKKPDDRNWATGFYSPLTQNKNDYIMYSSSFDSFLDIGGSHSHSPHIRHRYVSGVLSCGVCRRIYI